MNNPIAGLLLRPSIRELQATLDRHRDEMDFLIADYRPPCVPRLTFKSLPGREISRYSTQGNSIDMDTVKIADRTQLLDHFWTAAGKWFYGYLSGIFSTSAGSAIEEAELTGRSLSEMEEEGLLSIRPAYFHGYIKHCGIKPGSVVLDIGTSGGSVAGLASIGARNPVIGADISFAMLKVASGAYNQKSRTVDLINIDGMNLPFRDSSIDIALSTYTLSLLPPALRNILLKEVFRTVRQRFVMFDYPHGVSGWEPETWEKNLVKIGFRESKVVLNTDGKYFIWADKTGKPCPLTMPPAYYVMGNC